MTNEVGWPWIQYYGWRLSDGCRQSTGCGRSAVDLGCAGRSGQWPLQPITALHLQPISESQSITHNQVNGHYNQSQHYINYCTLILVVAVVLQTRVVSPSWYNDVGIFLSLQVTQHQLTEQLSRTLSTTTRWHCHTHYQLQLADTVTTRLQLALLPFHAHHMSTKFAGKPLRFF